MKNRFLLILALAFAPIAFVGCSTAPDQRTAAVTTLKIVGQTADTAMMVAAQLYHDGKISQAQWNHVAVIHDQQFLPAYKLAIAAVQSDLSSVASPDLQNLANALAGLVASFQPSTP